MGHPHPILIAQPVLTFHNLPQRREKAVDFFGGVVVDEADAEEAAGFFHVELLGEVQSVVVSVPGEETAVAEFGGEGEWSLVLVLINDADCERGASPVEARGIGDAVDLQFWNFGNTGDEALHQSALVAVNGFEGGDDGGAAVR